MRQPRQRKKKTSVQLKALQKLTGAVSFKDSKYGKPNHYISTGCLALNRIISGSVKNGIPSGRVIIFAGENSTGKTLISANIAASALNECFYDDIFYFDSEGGGSEEFFSGQNVDTSLIYQILVKSVEDCAIKLYKQYDYISKQQVIDPEYRALCIVDSIGALVSEKLFTDFEKGRMAGDMGLTAKTINNMVKSMTIPALITDSACLFLNHTYADPAAMYASKVHNQKGGRGLQFMASVNIQCARVLEKTESVDDVEGEFKGTTLRFFTIKNRLVKPFLRTDLHLDFDTGATKYDGLFDAAVDYGFIEQSGGWYTVPSYKDTKIRKSEILVNDAIWETFLDEFEDRSMREMSYSRHELLDLETQEKKEEAEWDAIPDEEETKEM